MSEARRIAKVEFIKSVLLNPGCKYPNGHTYVEGDGEYGEVFTELQAAGVVDAIGSYKWVLSDEIQSAMAVAIENGIIDELEERGLL